MSPSHLARLFVVNINHIPSVCVECSIFISIRSFVLSTSLCLSIYSISYYDYYNNFFPLSVSCKHVDSIEKELLQVNGHECAYRHIQSEAKEKCRAYNKKKARNRIFYSIASHQQHRQCRQQYVQPRIITER